MRGGSYARVCTIGGDDGVWGAGLDSGDFAMPFPNDRFDAIASNDAMCHIEGRLAALRDWCRVLRPGGRALFTDAMVLTGIVSHEELAIRSSIGFYLFVPPGENEKLLRQAGFVVQSAQDVTANAAEVAQRWHFARDRHQHALVAREGRTNFDSLQRFLRCVHTLSSSNGCRGMRT